MSVRATTRPVKGGNQTTADLRTGGTRTQAVTLRATTAQGTIEESPSLLIVEDVDDNTEKVTARLGVKYVAVVIS